MYSLAKAARDILLENMGMFDTANLRLTRLLAIEDPNGFSRWVLNFDPTETSDVGILSQVSDFALKKGGEHEG